MTEQEWFNYSDPTPMLEWLRDKVSDRKLRLFACGYFRRIWHLVTERRCQKIVEISELYADGVVKRQALSGARQKGWNATVTATAWNVGDDNAWIAATRTAENYHYRDILAADEWKQDQSTLLRCIFGNPFRPIVLDSSWLTPSVLGLAQAAYDERCLPSGTLDKTRLAILGDCLEDAGCRDSDILSHLRHPGEHVRGCWVLDLLLGKK